MLYRAALLTAFRAVLCSVVAIPATMGAALASDAEIIRVLRGATHAEVQDAYDTEVGSWAELKVDQFLKYGAPPSSDAGYASTALFRYTIVQGALADSDLLQDTPPKDVECRRFIEADRKIGDQLDYALTDIPLIHDGYQSLRNLGRIVVLDELASEFEELVSEGKEGGEPLVCAKGESCAGPPCFSKMSDHWKRIHVERRKAREEAVTAAVGIPGLTNSQRLVNDLAQAALANVWKVDNRNYALGEALKWYGIFSGFGWVNRAIKILGEGSIVFRIAARGVNGLVFSSLAKNVFHLFSNQENLKDYEAEDREGTLSKAEIFEDPEVASQTILDLLSPLATATSKQLLAMRADPEIMRSFRAARTRYGSDEAAFARIPVIEAKLRLIRQEMDRRHMPVQD